MANRAVGEALLFAVSHLILLEITDAIAKAQGDLLVHDLHSNFLLENLFHNVGTVLSVHISVRGVHFYLFLNLKIIDNNYN